MTTTDADLIIAALHTGHDDLAPLVAGLSGDDLRRPSAAADWDVSQVLSHIGSGAVIAAAGLDASLKGEPNPGADFARPVWARWDAMSPEDRRDGFLRANTDLLAAYDALDADTRASLRIDLGFLPEPVDLATAARFRLNEFSLHSWDVRVTFDGKALVRSEAVPLLLDMAAFMMGWLGKAEAVGGRELAVAVRLHDPDRALGLQITDAVAVAGTPDAPDARIDASAEAWLRLVSGRTPANGTSTDLAVSGALDLATLRRVFPGY
jgi:uncharacterized protein (TIGR03083 family)